jgi:dGTPase
MDIADEIAYAAHDLEDALRSKYINTDDIEYLFGKEIKNKDVLAKFDNKEISAANDELKKIFQSAKEYAKTAKVECVSYTSDDAFETVRRKQITSKIVNSLINDVDYLEPKDDKQIRCETLGAMSYGLKKFLFETLKNQSEYLLQYEKVGEKIIRGLYAVLTDGKFNKGNELLSATYRNSEKNDSNARKRCVIDYIAGMTDKFAREQYIYYFGTDPWEEGVYTNFGRKNK